MIISAVRRPPLTTRGGKHDDPDRADPRPPEPAAPAADRGPGRRLLPVAALPEAERKDAGDLRRSDPPAHRLPEVPPPAARPNDPHLRRRPAGVLRAPPGARQQGLDRRHPLARHPRLLRLAGPQRAHRRRPNGGRRSAGPMDRLDPPKITVTAPPVLTTDQVKSMHAECDVRRNDGPMWRFIHRRDRALLLTMFATGIRRAEVAAIKLEDLNLNEQQVHIPHGKGDKARTVSLGPLASEAIDDYLIVRNQHPHARSPFLWLAPTGPLGYSGVGDVIDRVARAAGITFKVHPHLFRHTMASNYLTHPEAQEGDLMRLMGWTSTQMLRRYGASAAEQRALAAAKRIGVADRLLARDPVAERRRKR